MTNQTKTPGAMVPSTPAQKLWQLQIFLDAAGFHEEAKLAFDAIQQLAAQAVQPPAVGGDPDKTLCKFYEVDSYPDLVRELVDHVSQLQDSAKRNVKPWEDTFPPTLLPAYIARIDAENAKAQPATAKVDERAAFNTWKQSGLGVDGVGADLAAWQAWQARANLKAVPE
jgi:hypothetical protein